MDALDTLIKLTERFGLAAPAVALSLWLFWLERSERKELSAKLVELTEAQIKADEQMTAALNILTVKVTR